MLLSSCLQQVNLALFSIGNFAIISSGDMYEQIAGFTQGKRIYTGQDSNDDRNWPKWLFQNWKRKEILYVWAMPQTGYCSGYQHGLPCWSDRREKALSAKRHQYLSCWPLGWQLFCYNPFLVSARKGWKEADTRGAVCLAPAIQSINCGMIATGNH